ncbi:hypothetical protein H6G54_25720 [Anabaena cylindrica FACHB-243]|uniref:hypothetical protein n=1 Tax=Anabaena TaxID=1163 RepID=UPI000B61DF69|nr:MULTISPECIES: hypothetical protein [Anabaena]BAY05655.1 hypothetical protein NIES19_49300 [Anabaena cylindrica PCC 7122]MBD2421036.1 hypothetical protein [Anabaena cylindrica FACHB-243]MBY5280740.1 hypothetical protein [Anabaena sp. CCAP 1446/1C]MBY5306393.1 hypothetical protein [Anabaena sp. CCAP 1446/1C]MCM2405788.1 hypothetical protein [Anabaena sp. CCAP 1446/1C]
MNTKSTLQFTKGAILRLSLLFMAMIGFVLWLQQSGSLENPQLLETLYRQGNYIEAVLWSLFSLGFMIYSYKRNCLIAKHKNQITSVIFLLFGLSDIIEVQTGGWWKPWWLLLWKSSCVIGFIVCFWDYLKIQHSKNH